MPEFKLADHPVVPGSIRIFINDEEIREVNEITMPEPLHASGEVAVMAAAELHAFFRALEQGNSGSLRRELYAKPGSATHPTRTRVLASLRRS